MHRPIHALALAAAALLAAPPAPASAQSPKPGDWYEDTTHLGFKVRMPDDWSMVPPAPDDPHLIGRYEPQTAGTVFHDGAQIPLVAFLLKFDPQDAPPTDPEELAKTDLQDRRRAAKWHPDLESWLQANFRLQAMRGGFSLLEEDETKVDKTRAVERVFEAKVGEEATLQVYTMEYDLGNGVRVAVAFDGPGGKKWRKYETSFKRMAKSFQRVEVTAVDFSSIATGESSLRARKKAKLLEDVARAPGWELRETPNYFILTNSDDQKFLREVEERVEAIRAQFEEHFPPARIAAIREQAEAEAAAAAAAEPAADADGEEEAPPEPSTVARAGSSMEQSRCSVVRVCNSQKDYMSYGGPQGSAGYWNWVDEELVLYDDQVSGGRNDTWAVLNHEAFHQYIFYFFGNLSPHTWYNEGNADVYAGYEYKNGRSRMGPFRWRTQTIKDAIREGKHVPLKTLCHYTQREYYGENKENVPRGQNYAQGWSFVYFLRNGQRSRGWNARWDSILDTYLITLAATSDTEKANAAAFEGVDWEALESAWIDFTK